jgi:hypothetical protein
MIRPDDELPLTLTASDINLIMAGLGELPFKLAAPVIDRVKQQVLAHDPTAFEQPPRINGEDVVRQ